MKQGGFDTSGTTCTIVCAGLQLPFLGLIKNANIDEA